MKPANLIIHPSCPKKLITALRRAKSKNGNPWSFSALARQLSNPAEGFKVNKGTIHKLVTKGIQPKDESIRLALFLPRHPRKKQNPAPVGSGAGVRVQLSSQQKWWRKQPKEFKDTIILQAWLSS